MAYHRKYRRRNYRRPYYRRRHRPIDPKKLLIALGVLLIFGILSDFEAFLKSLLFPVLLGIGAIFITRKVIRERKRSQIKNSFNILRNPPPRQKESTTQQPFEKLTRKGNETNKQENVGERYSLKKSLITPTEKKFLEILEQVVGEKYHIENQVQLSGIVSPSDSRKHYTNYRDFNRIKAKSIDFVLYDEEYRPFLCIELDDHTHQKRDRIERDRFVDEVMSGVGLPIVHIPVSDSYDIKKLQELIFEDLRE